MNEKEDQSKKRGGARRGSGRKRIAQKKITTPASLSPAVHARLKELVAAKTHGHTSNIIETALIALFKTLNEEQC